MHMSQHLGLIALLVKDYDEAIKFYTEILGFVLIEDTALTPIKRWVIVSPKGNENKRGCKILLAKAATKEQLLALGNQTGGRVFLFVYTDDIERDMDSYSRNGVEFVRPIINESYGKVAVFKDLYGNLWDLIQPFH